MEFLMFVGTAYAMLYVLWLLVMIVSGMPERWIDTTMFFVVIPVVLAVCVCILIITMFVAPFILFFSTKARQEFRDKMREQDVI